jgi:GT2 family glycosyltransferase
MVGRAVISLIIPIKPGLEPQAAARIAGLGWPADQYELLIAEGTCPSRQRNLAVQQARGEIIYFLDDDALVAADALERLAQRFSDPQVVTVGGPSLTPLTDSLLQRAFGAVFTSLLGAGGVRNRYQTVGEVRQTTERELILCNLAFRRDAFLASGGLDERLYPNEENELLDRLRSTGGVLLHDPQLAVYRSQRPTLAAFARQLFRYGRGRAEQTRIAGFSGLMPFVPLGFLLYLLTLPVVSHLLWFAPLALYLLADLLCSLRAALRYRTPAFVLLLPFLFPLLHSANGLGLLVGFLLPLKQQSCYNHPPVSIRRLIC